jgi:hypothetical protein
MVAFLSLRGSSWGTILGSFAIPRVRIDVRTLRPEAGTTAQCGRRHGRPVPTVMKWAIWGCSEPVLTVYSAVWVTAPSSPTR